MNKYASILMIIILFVLTGCQSNNNDNQVTINNDDNFNLHTVQSNFQEIMLQSTFEIQTSNPSANFEINIDKDTVKFTILDGKDKVEGQVVGNKIDLTYSNGNPPVSVEINKDTDKEIVAIYNEVRTFIEVPTELHKILSEDYLIKKKYISYKYFKDTVIEFTDKDNKKYRMTIDRKNNLKSFETYYADNTKPSLILTIKP